MEQPNSASGTAVVTPSEPVVAGQRGTWTVVFTVGEEGIRIGGGIRLLPPQKGCVRWECGHIICRCSRPEAALEMRTRNVYPLSYHHSQYPEIIVQVFAAPLRAGDTISVTLGDRGEYINGFSAPARAQDFAKGDNAFEVYVDAMGNANYTNPKYPRGREYMYLPVRDFPRIDAVAGRAARLVINALATPRRGESCKVSIHAEDEWGNVATDYRGTVELRCSDPSAEGPKSYTFQPDDRGARVCHDFRVHDPCIHTVSAIDWDAGLMGSSNPIAVDFMSDYQILFGEIHHKTAQSDGLGTHDESYAFARDVMGLEFSGVSDHEGGRDWQAAIDGVKKHYEPGRFITVLGYEYSRARGMGHRNVYFPVDAAERYSPEHPQELWEWLEGKEAVVIPHHPNTHSEGGPPPSRWSVTDWENHHPHFERLVEICQNRGSFETDEIGGAVVFGGCGHSVQDALKMGYKLGFIGGTDNHRGQPGSYRSTMGGLDYNEYRFAGLAAVLVKDFTREGLWDALWNRRCYATLGTRVLMDFRINGALMGQTIQAVGQPLDISCRAIGTDTIAKIELLRNCEVVDTLSAGAPQAELSVTDRAESPAYYYARVTQADGKMAWASPIWVE